MCKKHLLSLEVKPYKERWELEVYLNTLIRFSCRHWFFNNCQRVNCSLPGMTIHFFRRRLSLDCYIVQLSHWEKLIAVCAGAYIYEDAAYFKDSVHAHHLAWLFKGKLFRDIRELELYV
jgi:hypothetical protein